MPTVFFSPYVDSVLVVAFAYAVVTIGLQVTLASGQFSVAHAALLGLGGYAGGVVSAKWTDVPFVVPLAAGALIGGLAGLVLAAALIRTSGVLLGTVTIAIGQAAAIVMRNTDQILGVPTNGSQGLTVPTRTTLPIAFACAAATLALAVWVTRTRVGQDVTAVGRDETVAASLGIGLLSTRLWGFGLGGAMAGLGGSLLAHNNGVIEPRVMTFAAEPLLFVFLVVGGFATPWGAALGAVVMWWLAELLRFPWSATNTFGVLGQADRYWILGVILVAVVLYRQEGLLPRRPRRLPPAARRPAPAATVTQGG